ncbi:MAG: 3,4-dihydroxy-2-butanone-4-phosphate synthase [Proteobacteria bacterium]|nr:3,4-dihydroxy-2-butanone-4-phosphate synthase [Pseudomonadota bacterium]
MPTRSFPAHPSLEFLRKQAKDQLHTMQQSNPQVKLADAQWQLAKEYGFASWPKLKASITDTPQDQFSGAIRALRSGQPVILFDDIGGENEGDFIFAAEKITPEAINFLTKFARGTLCLALAPEQIERLGLSLISPDRESPNSPAFTVSIDAREGVTTGVSAADRARTILAAIADDAEPGCVRSPGHIFPLKGEAGGIKARQGHTEGSLDLVKRAGLKPGAVTCKILNEDGSMARLADVNLVAERHGAPVLCMSELLN